MTSSKDLRRGILVGAFLTVSSIIAFSTLQSVDGLQGFTLDQDIGELLNARPDEADVQPDPQPLQDARTDDAGIGDNIGNVHVPLQPDLLPDGDIDGDAPLDYPDGDIGSDMPPIDDFPDADGEIEVDAGSDIDVGDSGGDMGGTGEFAPPLDEEHDTRDRPEGPERFIRVTYDPTTIDDVPLYLFVNDVFYSEGRYNKSGFTEISSPILEPGELLTIEMGYSSLVERIGVHGMNDEYHIDTGVTTLVGSEDYPVLSSTLESFTVEDSGADVAALPLQSADFVVPTASHVHFDAPFWMYNLTNRGHIKHHNSLLHIQGNFTFENGSYVSDNGNLIVGGGFYVEDGVFNAGSGHIELTSDFYESFELLGGQFIAPSGVFTLRTDWYHTGGSFDPNGGTVVFEGTTHTVNASSDARFNNLVVRLDDESQLEQVNETTVHVDGELRLIDGQVIGGDIFVAGTVVHAPTFDGGTSMLVFDSSPSTVLLSPGGAVPGLHIAHPNVTVLASHRPANEEYFSSPISFTGPIDVEQGSLTISNADAFFTYDSTVTVNGGRFSVIGGTTVFENTLTLIEGNVLFDETRVSTDSDFTVSGGRAVINADLTANYPVTITDGTLEMPSGESSFFSSVTIDGGTLKLGESTVEFEQDFEMSNGSFIGQNANVVGQAFTVSDGIFHASNRVVVRGSFSVSDTVEFHPHQSTVVLESSEGGLSLPVGLQLYNLTVATEEDGFTYISGTPLVQGELQLLEGFLEGETIIAHGTVVAEPEFDGSSAALELQGEARSLLDYRSQHGFIGGINIQKASSVHMQAPIEIGTESQEITVHEGTLVTNNHSIELTGDSNVIRIAGLGTLEVTGNEVFSLMQLDENSTVRYNRAIGRVDIHDLPFENLILYSPDVTSYLVPDAGTVVTKNLVIDNARLEFESTEELWLAGSLLIRGTGEIDAGEGVVTLNGGTQYIQGSHTFHSVVKDSEEPGETLIFDASSVQTIEGNLALQGRDCNHLLIRSSIPGSSIEIHTEGVTELSTLNVRDVSFTDSEETELDCLDECISAGNISGLLMGEENTCTISMQECGDGVIEGEEVCDDGNLISNDGCNIHCEAESGFSCQSSPSECTSICGDGIVVGSESCDDGNLESNDGCTNECQIEPGYECLDEGQACSAVCGDGLRVDAESCDDGNAENGDGCTSQCTVGAGYSCSNTSPSVCFSECGDGVLSPTEECDDSNMENGDGCSDACILESEVVCTGSPSTCMRLCDGFYVRPEDSCVSLEFLVLADICGNGVVENDEECDDGNDNDLDHCSNECTLSVCGDGVHQRHEECDDGNDINTDNCLNSCRIAFCGDYVLNKGAEECDPPGVAQPHPIENVAYECLDTCVFGREVPNFEVGDLSSFYDEPPDTITVTPPPDIRVDDTPSYCGDETVDEGEECDHGELNGLGPCSVSCTLLRCGDGILSPHLAEECDDGNTVDDDSCTNQCTQRVANDGLSLFQCGNGILEEGEQCDDGNLENGDGCSTECTHIDQVPSDSSRPDTPVIPVLRVDEEKDQAVYTTDFVDAPHLDTILEEAQHAAAPDIEDTVNSEEVFTEVGTHSDADEDQDSETEQQSHTANSRKNDGEDAIIVTDQNEVSREEEPICGDGRLDAGEECDDGNLSTGDGCSNVCTHETIVAAGAVCGDGVVEHPEQCDGGFGCTNACTKVPDPICGNGIMEAGELCDDGNIMPLDGCNHFCMTEVAPPSTFVPIKAPETPQEIEELHKSATLPDLPSSNTILKPLKKLNKETKQFVEVTEPPVITGITIPTDTSMLIRFKDPINPSMATDANIYTVTGSPELPIERIEVLDRFTVRIHFASPLEEDHEYTVTLDAPLANKPIETYQQKVERKSVQLPDAIVQVVNPTIVTSSPATDTVVVTNTPIPQRGSLKPRTAVPPTTTATTSPSTMVSAPAEDHAIIRNQTHSPIGDTGPAALIFVAIGAAAGVGTMRRKK